LEVFDNPESLQAIFGGTPSSNYLEVLLTRKLQPSFRVWCIFSLNKRPLLVILPLLAVVALLSVPQIPPVHANPFTGTVCVEDFTSVPQTNSMPCNHVLSVSGAPVGPTFDGPFVTPNHQIQIGLYVNGSDPLNGWDITLKADHTLFVPAYRSTLVVDPTHSLVGPENIPGASLAVVVLCVQGISVVGNCLSTDTIDTLHYSVVGGKTTASPSGGLLFITGSTPPGGISIGYQSGCAGSQSVPGSCIAILTGTPNPAPETSMTATFNNSGTTAPGVCAVAPCTGVPYVTVSSSAATLNLLAGKSGSVTLTATAQSGWPGNAVPPGASNDLVTFTDAASTGLTVGLAAGTTCTTGGASCSSPAISVSAAAIGNYAVTFIANYVANSYDTGQNNTLAAPVTVNVKVTDYSWSVTPTTVNIPKGASPTVMTGTLTSLNGFSGTVFFLAAASPVTGLTTTFTPASVPVASGGTSTVNISFSATAETRFSDTLRACSATGCAATGLVRNAATTVVVNGFNITDTSNHAVTFTTTAGIGSDSIKVQSLPAGSVNGYGATGTSGVVTFTASVSPSTGLTAACTSLTVPAGGTVTGTNNCTFTSTTAGTYVVTINGLGGTNNLITNSTTVTVTVTGGVTPGVNIGASPTSVTTVVGAPGTSTVTLTSRGGFTGSGSYSYTATGGLTCTFNPTTFTLGATATTTLSCSSPTVQTDTATVTATSGTTTNSTTVTFVIQKASTTTTVVSSANPSVFGQSVTFTATVAVVSPGAGSPAGTVNFLDGATVIGSGTLSASAPITATFTTSTLAVGAHSITASYAGNANFNGSTSAVLTQTVNKASTTTTVASSVNPSVFGQSVTFTATVAVVAPGPGSPSGTVTFLDGATTLGTGTLSAGTAAFTTSTLAVGSHSITASYGGDTNFTGSTSALLTQTVNKASTTTTVASSANPSVFGQSVTFTATVAPVAPGAGSPSGAVNFLDGTITIGSGTLSASSPFVATFTTSSLAVGSHSITASYAGNSNFSGSTSATLTQTVNPVTGVTMTTTIQNSANVAVTSIVLGTAVHDTATLSGQTATAGGTVTYAFWTTGTCTGTPTTETVTVGNGVIPNSSAKTPTAAGSSSFNATYSGDTSNNRAVSGCELLTVTQASTTTAVVSSVNPSVFGQSVTFTATVTGSTTVATPTGTVQFKDGTTVLATISVTTTAGVTTATFTTSTLAVGSHSITATYGGDTNFTGSTSAVLTQTVNKASTSTTVASSANPSAFGQSVIFTATVGVVAPGAGSPSGTVTFLDGATTLGTGTLSGGTATFTTSALAIGSHSITASYGGDTNFNGSTSAVLTQTINPVTGVSINTTIRDSTNAAVTSVVLGTTVHDTATLSGQTATAGGTVSYSFWNTGTCTGTRTAAGSVTVTNGVVPDSNTVTPTAAGSFSINATYSGDTNNNRATSPCELLTVAKAATTTIVTSSANPSVFGQSVTLRAAVTGSTTVSNPSGTVTFLDGTVTLGTGTLSGGTATFTISVLAVGSHSITASYGGDTNFTGSTSAVLTQTVNKDSNTVSVASSVNPSDFGQSVTFTATVTVVAPGASSPSGTVTFLDGTVTLGTGTLSAGSATFTTSTLAVGSHSITASYGGDANNAGATSAVLTQTVNPQTAVTITTVIEDSTNTAVTSIVVGNAVHDTAALTGVTATAGGTVTYQFFTGSSCSGTGTTVGSPVTVTNGVVPGSAAQIFNNAGSFSWNAVYIGDSNNNGATSACEPLTVTKASPTITTSLSVSVIPVGGSVTDSATLKGSFQAGGTVTYNLFNSGTCGGTATVVSTVTVTGGIVPAASSQTFSTAGSFGWNAVYSGDANNNPATSACESLTVIPTTGNPILLTFSGRDLDDFENGIGQLQVLVNGHLVVDIPAGLNHLSGSGDYAPYEDKWIRFGPFDITSFVVQGQNTVLFMDPQTADHFGLIKNVTIVQGDTVLLQVARARGIYPGFSVTYTFSIPPLVLTGFTVSDSGPAAGQNVTFTATYTGGTGPFKCIFSFGDGKFAIVNGVAGVCSAVHHYDDSDTSPVDIDTFTARVIIIGSSTSDRVTGQLSIALSESE